MQTHLGSSGCIAAALQVESIRERLEAEFTALEAANVHAIVDSAASVPKVVQKINVAFTKLEDLELTLDVFDGKLSAMRDDIAAIESRNNSLETQTRSLERLRRATKELLGMLAVRTLLLCLALQPLCPRAPLSPNSKRRAQGRKFRRPVCYLLALIHDKPS
jgi:hypothetical protein